MNIFSKRYVFLLFLLLLIPVILAATYTITNLSSGTGVEAVSETDFAHLNISSSGPYDSLVLYYSFDYFNETSKSGNFKNAVTYLEIPTWSTINNETVHPSIIRFDDPWNGYDYWLCAMPYSNSNHTYESPSIYACNSSQNDCASSYHNWTAPQGLLNPVNSSSPNTPNTLFSDCEIAYDNDADVIVLYNRMVNDTHTDFLYQNSTNGVNWTNETVSISWSLPHAKQVSPTVIKKDGIWYMWYPYSDGVTAEISYRNSTDGVNWGNTVNVSFNSGFPVAPWHMDITYISSKEEYWLVYMKQLYSDLYMAKSSDGFNWEVYSLPVLEKNSTGWDSVALYRSTLAYNEDNDMMELWYGSSNWSGNSEWRIGYTNQTYINLVNYFNKEIDDYSEFNNDAVLKGVDENQKNVSGIIGRAYEFDGLDDRIKVSSNDSLELTYNGTVSLWFYQNEDGNYKQLIDHRSTGNTGWEISVEWNQKLNVQLDNGPNFGLYWNHPNATDVASGKWHHVAFTWDNSTSTMAVYHNGILVFVNGSCDNGPINASIDVYIGSSDIGNYWNGSIDEVMIFNTSLNSTQIRDIYNNQSARFASQGNYSFSQDITLGSYLVNVTNQYEELFDTNINLTLGYYDGSWSSAGTQVINSSNEFDITTGTSEITVNYTFYSDTNNFYSPLIKNQVGIETYSVDGGSSSVGGSSSYKVMDYNLKKGYNKELKVSEKIYFNIKDEGYQLRIEKINEDSVLIRLSSSPMFFNLKINEIKKIDMDKDGYYDLYIKLNNIIRGRLADLSIKSINEKIEKIENVKVVDEEEVSHLVIKDVVEEPKEKFEVLNLLCGILVAILVAISVDFLIVEYKKLGKD